MKPILIAFAALALSGAPALAAYQSDTGAATSMGRPLGSPDYAAPRSAVMPGSPAHEQAQDVGKNPSKIARCGSFRPAQGCEAKPPTPPAR